MWEISWNAGCHGSQLPALWRQLHFSGQKVLAALCLLLTVCFATNAALGIGPEQLNQTKQEKQDARLLRKGSQLLNAGLYKEAIKLFEKINERQLDWKACFQLANCYRELGKPRKALEYYNESIRIEETSRTLNNRGNVYLKMGKYALAVNDYNRAIRLNPINAYAYNNRGAARIFHQDIAAVHRRDVRLALEDFTKAINLRPNRLDTAYFNRGLCYNLLGSFETAIENFDKAIEFNPNNYKYPLRRAYAHLSLGNSELGEDDLRQALHLGATPELVTKIREEAGQNLAQKLEAQRHATATPEAAVSLAE